jgi:LPS O-antigen subunit length determinant protein (WzzB/FepE family)|tara:strand:+ start:2197 stop:2586 length:390 start_codon:yes stop_codon:yes gene_type:complete
MSAYIYSITFLTKGEYVMNMKKLSMFSDQAEDIKLGDMENWLDQEIANTSDQSIKEELKKHYNNISNIRTFYAQHQYNKHQEENLVGELHEGITDLHNQLQSGKMTLKDANTIAINICKGITEEFVERQ